MGGPLSPVIPEGARGAAPISADAALIHQDVRGRRDWQHRARHVGVELDTIRLVRATGVPERFAEEYPDPLQSASAVRS